MDFDVENELRNLVATINELHRIVLRTDALTSFHGMIISRILENGALNGASQEMQALMWKMIGAIQQIADLSDDATCLEDLKDSLRLSFGMSSNR